MGLFGPPPADSLGDPGTPELRPFVPFTPVGHRLDLPGRGTTFVREVPGPPDAMTVILLHGWTVTADLNWATAFTALGRHFHVVAPDHRGHGQGIQHDQPFTLADCADDVAAICDALGIDQAIVVGYSMGGAIAQLTWRRHAPRVAGLVLCASSYRFSSNNKKLFAALAGAAAVARRLGPARRNDLANSLIRRMSGESQQREWALAIQEAHDWMKVIEAGRELSRFNSSPWIHRLDAPYAQVVMTQDDVVQTVDQRGCAALVGHGRVIDIEAGHGACTDDPHLFVPAVFDAVTSVARDLGAGPHDGAVDPSVIGFRKARPAPPPSLIDL